VCVCATPAPPIVKCYYAALRRLGARESARRGGVRLGATARL
jgi:hypothetical protein